MKIKQLIEILSKLDGDLDVGVLHDNGVDLAEEVGIYEGWLSLPYGHKMTCHKKSRIYYNWQSR